MALRLRRRIKWFFNGKPMIKYPGYNCGCCGSWNSEPFEIPEWYSDGKWWDTWGLCQKCIDDAKE